MAASSGTTSAATALLPPVKSVLVYKNGDPFYGGRRFVVNQRQVSTMEAFLNEVTQSIGASLAIRTLYTPRQGHRVKDLEDLQTGGQYVAAGFERFKKMDYLNTRLKKQPVAREGTQAKIIQKPNVSAKWRKFIPVPCIIHVFRNGDPLCPPFRFIIPRSLQQDLEQILGLVTEKVSLRSGAVRRLCSLDGTTVFSAEELQSGHCYVAVGAERFKKLPYVELFVSKAERLNPGKRRLSKRTEIRKAGSGPEDRYSDSALLDSPESDGRRVKSTGDEAAGVAATQVPQQRTGGEGKEEVSIFYSRPVRIRKKQCQPRPPVSKGPVQPSVFKRGGHKRREEVRGAEEVQEDDNTATELPVDQRVAETVEDEELTEQDEPLQKAGQQNSGKARTPISSPVNGTPTPVQDRRSIRRNTESDSHAFQVQSPTNNGTEQLIAAHKKTLEEAMENVALAEEDYASAAETVEPVSGPKMASSNSRASSATSPSHTENGGIQGQNRTFQGDNSCLKSSNVKKGSSQDSTSFIMEQTNCQEKPVAYENGGFVKDVTSTH